MVIHLYKDILMKSPDIKYEDLVTNLSKALGLGRETISKTIAEYRRKIRLHLPTKSVLSRLSSTKLMIWIAMDYGKKFIHFGCVMNYLRSTKY